MNSQMANYKNSTTQTKITKATKEDAWCKYKQNDP